jgi:hypothetical protein
VFGIRLPAAPPPGDATYEVWEENWETVMMFLRMHTQWNTTMAGYLGLKYDVLLMPGGLFDLYCIKDRAAMLEDLQVMESAALSELSKSEDK